MNWAFSGLLLLGLPPVQRTVRVEEHAGALDCARTGDHWLDDD
jgi:hypothetical protein